MMTDLRNNTHDLFPPHPRFSFPSSQWLQGKAKYRAQVASDFDLDLPFNGGTQLRLWMTRSVGNTRLWHLCNIKTGKNQEFAAFAKSEEEFPSWIGRLRPLAPISNRCRRPSLNSFGLGFARNGRLYSPAPRVSPGNAPAILIRLVAQPSFREPWRPVTKCHPSRCTGMSNRNGGRRPRQWSISGC